MVALKDVGEVEAVLEALSQREDGPFVRRLPREPGRRESRYAHLLCGAESIGGAAADSSGDETGEVFEAAGLTARVEQLEAEVAALRSALIALGAEIPVDGRQTAPSEMRATGD